MEGTEMKQIILSIKPIWAQKIYSGEKKLSIEKQFQNMDLVLDRVLNALFMRARQFLR